jgi:hypothetical protein
LGRRNKRTSRFSLAGYNFVNVAEASRFRLRVWPFYWDSVVAGRSRLWARVISAQRSFPGQATIPLPRVSLSGRFQFIPGRPFYLPVVGAQSLKARSRLGVLVDTAAAKCRAADGN